MEDFNIFGYLLAMFGLPMIILIVFYKLVIFFRTLKRKRLIRKLVKGDSVQFYRLTGDRVYMYKGTFLRDRQMISQIDVEFNGTLIGVDYDDIECSFEQDDFKLWEL